MFGFSFSELLLICVVALVAVGPKKLPGLLHTLGQWIRKARGMVSDMRAQSGIDEILRSEGLHGGINELRSLIRTPNVPWTPPATTEDAPAVEPAPAPDPYRQDRYLDVEIDPTKEYPPEGPDAYGALPDDLMAQPTPAVAAPVEAVAAPVEAVAAPKRSEPEAEPSEADKPAIPV